MEPLIPQSALAVRRLQGSSSRRETFFKLHINLSQGTVNFHQLTMSIILSSASLFLWFLVGALAASPNESFIYNGFRGSANIISDGFASITPDGLLRLTNNTKHQKGHAFYSHPLRFRKTATSGPNAAVSFSATFVFAIVPENSQPGGMGMAFLISPSTNLSTATGSQYLGIINAQDDGKPSNHIVAVELDTVYNPEFTEIAGEHVGIDINSLTSATSHTAGFYDSRGQFQNLSLSSGEPMQVWVEYNGKEMQFNVTLGPLKAPKPTNPLLSYAINLSNITLDSMYVGFSSSTAAITESHYVLGWSFKMDGTVAPALDISSLPSLPQSGKTPKKWSRAAVIWALVAVLVVLLVAVATVVFRIVRNKKFAELLEDWELEYGPQRFRYKDLYRATDGFRDKNLLGIGGFGRVYRGVLPSSEMEVAVKKVSHDSRQGSREFIAEVMSIGRLRHRNLVKLLGYCRRKGELLLVYEFMPNGSLDRILFDRAKPGMDWSQRFRVIKGIALGLQYLHEEWEQVVIHRDVKASNVLLDGDWNGKLGDFGLSRLYDRGMEPQTTRVVGTMGYIAPELLARCGKPTTSTDVYAFGAFLLEVACGRRPIERGAPEDEVVLVEWVLEMWRRGAVVESADPRLEGEYEVDEVELVLKLGLICSHRSPAVRPSMRQVVQILDGDINIQELTPDCLIANVVVIGSSESNSLQNLCSVSRASVLSEGR